LSAESASVDGEAVVFRSDGAALQTTAAARELALSHSIFCI
jgi:hypothetical protein